MQCWMLNRSDMSPVLLESLREVGYAYARPVSERDRRENTPRCDNCVSGGRRSLGLHDGSLRTGAASTCQGRGAIRRDGSGGQDRGIGRILQWLVGDRSSYEVRRRWAVGLGGSAGIR